MEEFLSTAWDYICNAIIWVISWIIVLGLILGFIGYFVGAIRGDYNVGNKLDEITDELKKLNSNKTPKQ